MISFFLEKLMLRDKAEQKFYSWLTHTEGILLILFLRNKKPTDNEHLRRSRSLIKPFKQKRLIMC